MQLTKQQAIAHLTKQRTGLSEQLEIAHRGVLLLQEAQRVLRAEHDMEKALDLLVGYQLGPALLGIRQMQAQLAEIEANLKQLDSPILHTSLVPPKMS